VARIQPFRALRYDTAVAGPLETLVAPPYDVIDDAAREELRGRSPHNVVHLTLPDSEEQAAADLARWRAEGALVEEEPAYYVVQQDYVGPDGVARTRTGLVASLTIEPYANGVVLPHERTHSGPKEGRLRLLRATGVQLEPIFLLYEAPPVVEVPARAPDLEVEATRLWRIDDDVAPALADLQLLIADGHHRYETALAFHEEEGTPESAQMLVVLVSTEDPGLTIFPTHRVFEGGQVLAEDGGGELDEALRALEELPADRAAAVQVTRDGAALVTGGDGELDVELIDTLGHEGIAYTPDRDEALRRVRNGEAGTAYLIRATPLAAVWAAARRGEVMPQKTTYFFPKLVTGLLFHPL
jgi:uncharacterized protein (DUF1015 family)